jgi:hypothetical protein
VTGMFEGFFSTIAGLILLIALGPFLLHLAGLLLLFLLGAPLWIVAALLFGLR